MKNSILFFAFLLPVLLWGDAGVLPPSNWEATGYQNNMTYYAQVLRPDGTRIEADDSILVVFDADGACRGAITPIDGPQGRLFQLGIASNATAEAGLTLMVLDTLTGEACPIQETVDFVNDAIVPEDGIVNPLQLHVVGNNGLILKFQTGWNLVSFPFKLKPNDETTLLTLAPFAVVNESYSRASTLEANCGYWFFVDEKMTFTLMPQADAPEAQPTPDAWSLVGAASETPSWLEQVTRLFQWDAQKGFVPVDSPVKGQGYWVK